MEGNRLSPMELAQLIGALRRDLQRLTLRVARLEERETTQGYQKGEQRL
jgi:hypothetical protein